MSEAVWFFALEVPGRRAEWDWATLGAPDPRELLPVRQPNSGDFSRHIPVSAYSVTTASHHELESGLEHELLRMLEARSDVVWMVAQPLQLHVPGRRGATHVPDFLSRHSDGSVTVWDARPAERVDELFEMKARFTRDASRAVGWDYEVFSGAEPRAAALNRRWLHEARRRQPWHSARKAELRTLFEAGSLTVDLVLGHDDGSGELTSTLWHHVWSGDIACDLDSQILKTTELRWEAVDG